jgi:hypothetical protein
VKSSFSLDVHDAFIVDPETLKKIHKLLADRIGTTKLVAECCDDVSREFSDLKGMLEYENAKERAITSLRISATSEDFKKSASVEFTGKWYSKGTLLRIEARDDVVTRLRHDILEVVSGTRPWYNSFARVDFALAAIVALAGLWLLLIIAVSFQWLPTSEESTGSNTRGTAIGYLIGVSGLGILAAVVYIVTRFRNAVFPRATFLLGQGKPRHERLEKVRWGVLVGFVTSFASGIAVLAFQ